MKIILSPAKKMITDIDSIAPDALPEFIEKTTEIQSWLKSKSKEELKTIWTVSYTHLIWYIPNSDDRSVPGK